jgi:hypothetical protein
MEIVLPQMFALVKLDIPFLIVQDTIAMVPSKLQHLFAVHGEVV